jgi:hypothetical protein
LEQFQGELSTAIGTWERDAGDTDARAYDEHWLTARERVVVDSGLLTDAEVHREPAVQPLSRRGAGHRQSHWATPLWPEQVPERFCEKLHVPSLHRAVAPAGATGPDWGRHTVLPSALT